MADDEKKEAVAPKSGRYSLTISVLNDSLMLILHDNETKRIYQSSFTSKELHKDCGFSDKMASNLKGISKFIETAKSGDNNLKFEIAVERGNAAKTKADDELAEEGGVQVTAGKDVEVGVVRITKEDDFFGTMVFTMRLQEVPREQSEVNKDHIRDLQQTIGSLQEESKKKMAAMEEESKQKMEEAKDKMAAMQKESNRQIVSLEQMISRLSDELKKVTKLQNATNEKLKIMQNETTDQVKNLQNEKKEERIVQLEQHQMPRGSIVMWCGAVKDIPKGWRLCDGNSATPDLRNRFIVGAGNEHNVGARGGNNEHRHNVTVNGHQLTVNEIPSHHHDFYQNVWVCSSNDNRYICDDSSTGRKLLNWDRSGDANRRTKASGGGQAHSHSATSSSTAHLPPFYALCFIMKVI